MFISPEALIRNEVFKQVIETANDAGYLRNLIIDEAHIVIEWGNFFELIISVWNLGVIIYTKRILN